MLAHAHAQAQLCGAQRQAPSGLTPARAQPARFTAVPLHNGARWGPACGGQARLVVVAAAAEAAPAVTATKRPAFPFTRIAGQEDMKLALLMNVVDPAIGGVLIMGDRGTGKSVAVRAAGACGGRRSASLG